MSVDWIYFNQQDANLQNGTAELPEEYEDVLYTDALGKVGTAQFVGSDNASRPVIIPISGKCLLDRANGRTGLVPAIARAKLPLGAQLSRKEETKEVDELFNAIQKGKTNGKSHTAFLLTDGTIWIEDVDLSYNSKSEAEKDWMIF